jgi:lipopolysaccharide export system protein LptA
LAVAAVCLLSGCLAPAGEPSSPQPYEKIRYPTFSNGRLYSLLEADQAEAYNLSENTPRVNLLNVVITLYDHSGSPEDVSESRPPPVKMIITSDRGYFVRRPHEPGGSPEEIANLEGNVVLRQMRLATRPIPENRRISRLDPSVETEVHCQHAQWNNTLRKLNGDGEVEFIQEDSRIVGTGFLYLADDEAMNSGGASNIRDWGGVMFIEHNARMEIERADGITEITCRDTASYKLTEREIQFERDVRLRRLGLEMESDILKVFLQREGDNLPESSPVLPGEVRNIIATIGKRPGSVVITGYEISGAGTNAAVQYLAKGGRADYDLAANRITLTDSRVERAPEVEFGESRSRISDRNLEFIFAVSEANGQKHSLLERLSSSGGQGQVFVRPRESGSTLEPTEISYKGSMDYQREDGRIRFLDSVFLKQGDLRIRSEILDARLTGGGEEPEGQIDRILAETDVQIQDGGREANSQRAEYDMSPIPGGSGGQSSLYTLRLYGPPQRTPPHPWVRDERGNLISAPEIHMQRLSRSGIRPDSRDRHLVYASGGVISCDFFTEPADLSEERKIISIKCEQAMEYNEATELAWFEGNVQVVSDTPEDNYVLTSDRLILNLPESADPNAPGKSAIRVRRIDAIGNARLEQDIRVCEASRIIRDFPTLLLDEGDIYLEGAPGTGGQPPQMAIYQEVYGSQIGSMFAAPRIMASIKGDSIRANGPGQLSMPDEIPGFRATIHFEGAAHYEVPGSGEEVGQRPLGYAKFRRRVVLRQESRNLVLRAEEVDATFLREDDSRPEAPGRIYIEQVGRLTRAEGRIGVRLEHALARQGRRVAVGDRGVIEFHDSGNTMRLSADRQLDPRRFAVARDSDGKTLTAPEIEVREGEGNTRASGPGELRLPGGSSEGVAAAAIRVIYGERGQMVYNELGLRIWVTDNVRVVQAGLGDNWTMPSLDGRCDRLDINLSEPFPPGFQDGDALSRVISMDATGSVLIRVYADPPPGNPNIDWLSRPGTTFFTRGDLGIYLVREGRIEVSSLPGRRSQLLLNVVDEGGGTPRRQRFKADRFILDSRSVPRRWVSEGQLESGPIGDREAFEFVD